MDGFSVHKRDTGAVEPFEYLEATAGTYSPGQLLKVDAGKLAAIGEASTATPAYVCMADKVVTAGDPVLAVNRVRKDVIYETSLSATAATADVGVKLQVAAGGKQAVTGAGTFEIVSLDGTNAGDMVRGRFV